MEGKDLLSDSDSKSSGGIWDSLSRWFELRCISCRHRALSIESKIPACISGNFSLAKKKKTFSGIRKRGQPRQLYPSVRKCLNGNFRPVWFSSRIVAFLSKLPHQLPTCRKFENFWLNGKRPQLHKIDKRASQYGCPPSVVVISGVVIVFLFLVFWCFVPLL